MRHSALHVEQALDGDATRYGDGVALLVGDLTYVYADDLMADTSREARALWTELRLELNIGQFLDIVGSARRERRRAEAEQICRYKSGKYTIERPLQLGALVTSAPLPAGVFEQLSAIGLPLGDAFQMRDDILRNAMNHLPPEQLALVRLAFFDSLSHSEIAEKTGLPLGTVKSRIRLAFTRLRRALEANGVVEAD